MWGEWAGKASAGGQREHLACSSQERLFPVPRAPVFGGPMSWQPLSRCLFSPRSNGEADLRAYTPHKDLSQAPVPQDRRMQMIRQVQTLA